MIDARVGSAGGAVGDAPLRANGHRCTHPRIRETQENCNENAEDGEEDKRNDQCAPVLGTTSSGPHDVRRVPVSVYVYEPLFSLTVMATVRGVVATGFPAQATASQVSDVIDPT